MKGLIKGAIVLVIGGVAYSFSQADVAKNLSKDTGMTEQQATEYIDDIPDDEFGTWTELGEELVYEGKELKQLVTETNCNEWQFDWESPTLSCQEGLSQITIFSNSAIALGNSYIKLDSSSATDIDIRKTINLIGQFNANLALEIIVNVVDELTLSDWYITNSYNKALLQSAFDN